MKKLLLGMLLTAVTSAAWAQAPATIQPVPAPVAVDPCSPPSCFPAPCFPALFHRESSPDCTTVPTTIVHKKVVYSSTCEKVCVPTCSLFSFLNRSSCESCDKDCRVITKHYLIKKVNVTECPSTKCVPVAQPVCDSCGIGHPIIGHSIGHQTVIVTPEPVPAPLTPSRKMP